VSPLHIVVAMLEGAGGGRLQDGEMTGLLERARGALARRFPDRAESIMISKDTQAVIAEAGRLAESSGEAQVLPIHLFNAALTAAVVKEELADIIDLERIAARFFVGAEPATSSSPDCATSPSRAANFASAADMVVTQGATATVGQPPNEPPRRLEGALRDYCSDLADQATDASAHPFVGREREITAVLETLCRKLKNNPLLIGKPGVGKTALVSAVAARLCGQKVPPRLQGKRILEVSRLRLLAEAKFAGDIEERLKTLLEDVQRLGDVILFFDEIHTLLSAGGAGGTGDVANLLKSALSKGQVTCVGATTLAEYYKYIARDEALARRFSTITIEEPSREETYNILCQTRRSFESYHGISIDEEAISLIIETAERYLQSRSFPDKAFDLLDKAAAKAALAGRDRLTRDCIAETLSETTGLPLEIMDDDPVARLDKLEDFLGSAVPGQARAVRDVARVVRIAKLGLELRPERPDGVFLFVGPEGVGKHEMALGLAKFLYGSSRKMIEFDLSQFTEVASMSRLIGAEPGYVGYAERSGLLAKAAEDNPHSVLYFRSVDLAHTVIQQFLGEALEQGRFTDATGARISLSNTTVVMSLSPASASTRAVHVGFFANHEEQPDAHSTGLLRATGSLHLRERGSGFGLAESLAAAIDEVVEFQVLDRPATERIISERLGELQARLEAAQPVSIELDPLLVSFFAERLAVERKSLGQLERLLQETVIIPFTHLYLDRHLTGARRPVGIRVEGGAVSVNPICT